MDTGNLFTVDLALLTFLLAVAVPILVGALTKLDLSGGVKGFINLVLSAVAGAIATAIDGGGVFTETALLAAGEALIVSVAVYYGLLKPSETYQAFLRRTAQFGIG